MKKNDDYKDIINMPHHVSHTRPHMDIRDRAAQFAPFAALTGHSDAIDKTARAFSEKSEYEEYTEYEDYEEYEY